MPRLQLCLPSEVAAEVKRRAQRQGGSVSSYLARLVHREIGASWPEGYFDEVIGGWKGEPLDRPRQGAVERRAGRTEP